MLLKFAEYWYSLFMGWIIENDWIWDKKCCPEVFCNTDCRCCLVMWILESVFRFSLFGLLVLCTELVRKLFICLSWLFVVQDVVRKKKNCVVGFSSLLYSYDRIQFILSRQFVLLKILIEYAIIIYHLLYKYNLVRIYLLILALFSCYRVYSSTL